MLCVAGSAGARAGSAGRLHEEVAVSHDLGQRDDVADDLTQIEGIGSRRAERLNAAGIRRYADLASSAREEIAAVLPDAGPAKIDAWRDKARELVLAAPARVVPDSPPGNGQRDESILVRVLVNEDGSIRRMTARHIRTGTEDRWPGLERAALFGFIEKVIGSAAPSGTAPAEAPAGQTRPAEAWPDPGQPRPAAAHRAPAEAEHARPASFAVLSVERTALRAAEPFTLTMTIELAGPVSHADRLAYSAVVVAMPLTGGPKQTVAKSDGLFATTSSAISIDAAGLPSGAYRLDGAVSLREPGVDRPVALAGITEGLLVQVLPS
jgi:predicted flap endonuclease-1-like 5' DNA nuclease